MKTQILELRRRIALLEGALSSIENARAKLNPVHFDTTHDCGRFMLLCREMCTLRFTDSPHTPPPHEHKPTRHTNAS